MIAKVRPILVLGGTGHYGRHVVRSLLGRGRAVRVMSRDAARARGVLGAGVDIVEGDITSRGSVVAALEGVGAVVISVSAFSPRLIRRLKQIERDAVLAVLDEARRARVRRVVYLSIYEIRTDVAQDLGLETAGIKLEVENALARSDLEWTVLGMAPSVELFFALIRGGTMIVPGGGPPALPTVSPVDAGEIAAQTILRDDLAGLRIRVVGPDAISFPEAARRISAAIGRRVRFLKVPLLPLRIVSAVAGPINPYLRAVAGSVELMNRFPEDVAAQALEDHRWLVDTFELVPTTLEMEARRRLSPSSHPPQAI